MPRCCSRSSRDLTHSALSSRHHPSKGYTRPKSFRLDGLKLGVLGNFASEKHDIAIARTFENALEKLRGLGAEIRHTALPTYEAVKGRRAGFLRVEVEAAYSSWGLVPPRTRTFLAADALLPGLWRQGSRPAACRRRSPHGDRRIRTAAMLGRGRCDRVTHDAARGAGLWR